MIEINDLCKELEMQSLELRETFESIAVNLESRILTMAESSGEV